MLTFFKHPLSQLQLCTPCLNINQKLEKSKVQYITSSRTMHQLQKDLEKVSSQRENAAKDGLIRPFLYLVSLSPVARLQVAINLGFVPSTTCLLHGLCHEQHDLQVDIHRR